MSIDIKRSIKPVNYFNAIRLLDERVKKIIEKSSKKELIWFLEHPSIFTGGSSFVKSDILDNSINLIKTKRGGKITWHGPGQLICYFVINLNNRKKDIRKFLIMIENTIIQTLKEFKIDSQSDRKNIGIWVNKKDELKKVASIGIRVKRWIAYHGFSINVDNDLINYSKIIPCGIKDRGVTNLKSIKNQNYHKLSDKLLKNLIINLKR